MEVIDNGNDSKRNDWVENVLVLVPTPLRVENESDLLRFGLASVPGKTYLDLESILAYLSLEVVVLDREEEESRGKEGGEGEIEEREERQE